MMMPQGAPPVVGRFVPFLAVATANCINIPMMRQDEIVRGVAILDEEGRPLGESRVSGACVLQHTVMLDSRENVFQSLSLSLS